MSMAAAEFGHMVRQHVAAMGQQRHTPLYAHVSSYDALAHRVRVVIPALRDADDNPVLSPWMPLGTVAAGAGGGFQYHPLTGATVNNPTAGEQVQVGFFDAKGGVSAAPTLHFNQQTPPPGTLLPANDPLAPGEMVFAVRAGGYIRVRPDGGIDINSAHVRLGELAGVLRHLVDERLIAAFNAHTHGNTPVPTQQLTLMGVCTTNTTAT